LNGGFRQCRIPSLSLKSDEDRPNQRRNPSLATTSPELTWQLNRRIPRAKGRRSQRSIAWQSILFGRFARCGRCRGRGRGRVEISGRPASEGILHCLGLTGFRIALVNVPENSAFRTGEVGPESMPRGAGTVRGVVLSRAGGPTRSLGTHCATALG
jgi:hypothetical protein